MLVLSRKPGEKGVIGNGITVTVVGLSGNRVRVGIAPDDVRILRGELAFWQDIPESGDEPAEPALRATTGRSVSAAEVRLLAHQKWEAAGRPGGDGANFWLEAERELAKSK